MGTARMGADPKSSVVDPDLRSHDHPNLFILGSAVNPVLARSLVASISETMGNEVAQAVSRMLDLNSDGDVASPPEETHGSPAASSSFGLPTSLLPQGALLPSPEDPPAVEAPQPG
jgi:hypothetical protein